MASVVGLVVAVGYILVFPAEAFTREDLLWSVGAGVFSSGARPLLYMAMERGPIVVAAPTIGVVSLVVPAVVGPLTGASLAGLSRRYPVYRHPLTGACVFLGCRRIS